MKLDIVVFKNKIKRNIIYRRLRKLKWKIRYIVKGNHSNRIEAVKKVLKQKTIYQTRTKVKQIDRLLEKTAICINKNSIFQHWIDENLEFDVVFSGIGNIPPEYSLILEHSLSELKEKYSINSNEVSVSNKQLLETVIRYINRIIEKIEVVDDGKYENLQKSIIYYKRMITHPAETLEEALQRILFWSSMFWQTDHKLIGLGRLDKLLEKFSNEDEEISKSLIMEFLTKLHDYYEYKSNTMLGDIGQIIVLGGLDENGEYYYNNLTKIFIEATKEKEVTDPKVLLRVSRNMPRELLVMALDSIQTGIGSPLLANDDVIIPALKKFGYESFDAHNYVTSACWEPVSYGNSLEQNNLGSVNFAKVFVELIEGEGFENFSGFNDIIEKYGELLSKTVKKHTQMLDRRQWELDPLFTLFTKECLKNNKDVACGGAKYNNYGILSVGLGNAINSLCYIKERVYDLKKLTLQEIKEEYQRIDFQHPIDKFENKCWFGKDDEDIILLTQKIMDVVESELSKYKNSFGGKVKFGLSSPSYVDEGKLTGATLDSRKKGDPLSTHISCDEGIAYTELIRFASELKYGGNKSNGNVVDFIVSPSFIENNYNKFIDFLQLAIQQGFFEMQMNVVKSSVLIEAKENPTLFPNLIVRVWGFSAYFKDLPEEYKDVLIKRALESEKIA
ncbi:MAG: pyruvate formate lyase family protein [Eubacteriales bacterium]